MRLQRDIVTRTAPRFFTQNGTIAQEEPGERAPVTVTATTLGKTGAVAEEEEDAWLAARARVRRCGTKYRIRAIL